MKNILSPYNISWFQPLCCWIWNYSSAWRNFSWFKHENLVKW